MNLTDFNIYFMCYFVHWLFPINLILSDTYFKICSLWLFYLITILIRLAIFIHSSFKIDFQSPNYFDLMHFMIIYSFSLLNCFLFFLVRNQNIFICSFKLSYKIIQNLILIIYWCFHLISFKTDFNVVDDYK